MKNYTKGVGYVTTMITKKILMVNLFNSYSFYFIK